MSEQRAALRTRGASVTTVTQGVGGKMRVRLEINYGTAQVILKTLYLDRKVAKLAVGITQRYLRWS